jgi:hypothetical protein
MEANYDSLRAVPRTVGDVNPDDEEDIVYRTWESQSEMETPCTDMPENLDMATSTQTAQRSVTVMRRGRSRTRSNPLA